MIAPAGRLRGGGGPSVAGEREYPSDVNAHGLAAPGAVQ
jgi:hypothetical protein